MNNAKVTTYFPNHTPIDVEWDLPENTQVLISEYGPYQCYSLGCVADDGTTLAIYNYAPPNLGLDLAVKNLVDSYNPEKFVKYREIKSVHTLEGTPENFVFFLTEYMSQYGLTYEHLNIGNGGEIGLRGGLNLNVDSQVHDLDPFINILWDLYQAYYPNYGQLSETYLKTLKDQNNDRTF